MERVTGFEPIEPRRFGRGPDSFTRRGYTRTLRATIRAARHCVKEQVFITPSQSFGGLRINQTRWSYATHRSYRTYTIHESHGSYPTNMCSSNDRRQDAQYGVIR